MLELDRKKIKKQLMIVGLATHRKGVATSLSAVDVLVDLYSSNKDVKIYSSNRNYCIVMDIITGRSNYATPFDKVINKAIADPGQVYYFVVSESDLQSGPVLEGLFRKLDEGLGNVVPIVVQSLKEGSNYRPIFANKTKQEMVVPYRLYEVTIGEGWGKLENTRHAIDETVTHKIYDTWASNIDEIQETWEKNRAEGMELARKQKAIKP